ncbi:hypothetical protein PCASD_11260 [Puccinia coronata f. sp. avenae]|uniref:Uncharacterized protein n=1 Tax=Puccinia coronata f. sp. avenae TaxID=200324 RepID=A0A2N5UJ34_9BASI|nr:hypothetical protein PCASD_11260 [Puccinia coronata f. sp. avenae]
MAAEECLPLDEAMSLFIGQRTSAGEPISIKDIECVLRADARALRACKGPIGTAVDRYFPESFKNPSRFVAATEKLSAALPLPAVCRLSACRSTAGEGQRSDGMAIANTLALQVIVGDPCLSLVEADSESGWPGPAGGRAAGSASSRTTNSPCQSQSSLPNHFQLRQHIASSLLEHLQRSCHRATWSELWRPAGCSCPPAEQRQKLPTMAGVDQSSLRLLPLAALPARDPPPPSIDTRHSQADPPPDRWRCSASSPPNQTSSSVNSLRAL